MAPSPVIASFPQVEHEQASGELRDVFEDIHNTLRLPWVAFAIRVMSQFPAFIPSAWAALKPDISTRYAERGADLVREASILPGDTPPDPRPKLLAAGWTEGEIERLQFALDALNYGNPKYLILITAWNEAWHERDAGGNGVLSGRDAELLPYGLAEGMKKFHLVDPDTATPDVQELLRRAKDTFLHHGPASDWRVLAAWPDFLKLGFDDALAPVALTAEFDETSRRIRAIAREHVRGFPTIGGVSRREMSEVLSPIEIAGLTGLLFMYNRFIADITIEVIRLKQAFSGAAAATKNYFPV